MKILKIRYLIAIVMLMPYLSGCATVPRGKPEAEAKLLEATKSLDFVNEQSAAFYAALGPVTEEIKRFCARPAWVEFEQVLLEHPSLRDPDNEIEVSPEAEARLADWGRTWKLSWEQMLVEYHDLVDKCTILEARRLALRERLLAAQAKYIAAVMLELSAGREQQGKEIYSVVEILDGAGAELNSYQLDDMGFYKVR